MRKKDFLALVIIGIVVLVFYTAVLVRAAEPTLVEPYKEWSRYGGVTTSLTGNAGLYSHTFSPVGGDSATNGVDSTGNGIHWDTVEYFFDVTGYTQYIFYTGVELFWPDSVHDDVDSHCIFFEILTGTEKAGSWWDPLNGVQERGIGDSLRDTIVCCIESTWVYKILADTLTMDQIKLRYIIRDSALVGDAVNDYDVMLRAMGLFK